MLNKRIIETNEGIQEEMTIEIFDRFARNMRDKGWNHVGTFIQSGITGGNVLEIGPGPGYIGLEWLKESDGSLLTGCEISWNMIKMAEKNAKEYGLETRAHYIEGNAMEMPFPKENFDGAFSNGSLHEWEDPVRVFDEIYRVLKSGGRYCITDMRRDVNSFIKWSIYFSTKPKEIRHGFLSSLYASYTPDEIKKLLKQSKLKNAIVTKNFFGLCITGKKI